MKLGAKNEKMKGGGGGGGAAEDLRLTMNCECEIWVGVILYIGVKEVAELGFYENPNFTIGGSNALI